MHRGAAVLHAGGIRIYRSWGMAVIGMTNATEARLAREAELCYATIALVTDYDVWHEDEEPVTVEIVVERLRTERGRRAGLDPGRGGGAGRPPILRVQALRSRAPSSPIRPPSVRDA